MLKRLHNGALLFMLIISLPKTYAQNKYKIELTDIDNFWKAFDNLKEAKSKKDSIDIIQLNYIDKATPNFKKFIRAKHYNSEWYVTQITRYPKYWRSLRAPSLQIKNKFQNIDKIYQTYKDNFPNFKNPTICIGIGCMGSGGITSKNLILIGAEIAVADSSVDISELPDYLKNILGNNSIEAYIAHEAIHTMQRGFPINEFFSLAKHKSLNLLNSCIVEGSCDFISTKFCGLNINQEVFKYGQLHEEELKILFKKAIKEKPFDFSEWLYNFTRIKDKPHDLGYYIGFKITESYYNKMSDKKKALQTILKRGRYKKVAKGGWL